VNMNPWDYPRRLLISETPPLRIDERIFVTLTPGDLVVWKRNESDRWGAGLVVQTHWVLNDWNTRGTEVDHTKWCYIPEALISWASGDFTYTSHNAGRVVSRLITNKRSAKR